MAERVIVVGGGLAGLSAACELLEQGCNVYLLEKETNLGGNSSKATCGIAAPGNALQRASGVQDAAKDLCADGPAAQALIQAGPGDVQWITSVLGVDSELVLRLTPGHGRQPRTIGTKTHFPGAVVTYAAIHVLQQVATAKPDRLQIITSARVTGLTKGSGGKVCGVAFEQGGEKKTLNGSVVMASGGYAGDLSATSVLSKYAPTLKQLPTTNDERASGDALALCTSAGAAVEALDKVEVIPTAAIIPGQDDAKFKVVISDAISGAGGKLLNAQGKRFVEELATAKERTAAMQASTASPPFRLVISAKDATAVQWMCDFYTQRKVMKKYGSAAELAREMGVPNLDASVGTGPVFSAMITPALYSCQGGLKTGWQQASAGKVLTAAGAPVPGLYAAGEATSAPFARLWSVSGIPLLYCIYSGRMAGRAAAADATAAKQPQDLRGLILSSLTAPEKIVEQAVKKESSRAIVDANGKNGAEKAEKKPEDMTKDELVAMIKDLQANGPPAPVDDGPKGISMDEVKKHNTKEDAWIVLNGQVIDVTKWIPIHPGGEQAIMAYMGQDASDEWNMIHKAGTVEKNLVAEGGNGPVLKGPLGGAAAPVAGGGAKADGGLTMDEVGKHTTESDVWVVINGKAYDVTKWVQVHPGGVQAIMAYAGKDASDEWNCIHKPGTVEKNMFPGNPNGPVEKGPVSGAAASAAPAAVIDDEKPPPDGNGGIPGPLGALIYLAFNLIIMLLKTIFFTGNLKFSFDNNRKGTIRSACFLLTFTIIHVAGNFVGMIKGPNEANGEGYFFDRIAWTGTLGMTANSPLSIVEEYLALALLLHVSVALKRSWDISINYCLYTGRWNMLLSGLTVLSFLTKHLLDIRFSSKMQYTTLRPPPHFVAWPGILEGRVFYEVDESIPLVRVRDLYTREVELFKDLNTSLIYTVSICIFWVHMCLGWKKLVPADALQIPKDHVKNVTYLGWIAATAVVSMYLSVVWYTYFAPVLEVHHVPGP